MEVSLIAAIFLLAVILMCHVGENFTERSFNSQIANLAKLAKHEDLLHFTDADFNQTDSKEINR
jgi:hypothetical protein